MVCDSSRMGKKVFIESRKQAMATGGNESEFEKRDGEERE